MFPPPNKTRSQTGDGNGGMWKGRGGRGIGEPLGEIPPLILGHSRGMGGGAVDVKGLKPRENGIKGPNPADGPLFIASSQYIPIQKAICFEGNLFGLAQISIRPVESWSVLGNGAWDICDKCPLVRKTWAEQIQSARKGKGANSSDSRQTGGDPPELGPLCSAGTQARLTSTHWGQAFYSHQSRRRKHRRRQQTQLRPRQRHKGTLKPSCPQHKSNQKARHGIADLMRTCVGFYIVGLFFLFLCLFTGITGAYSAVRWGLQCSN